MTKARAALRRWWWLLAVGALAGAFAGGASASLQPPVDPDFQATSVLLLDLDRSSVGAQQVAQQAALRVERGSVPERAAELLERSDPDRLVDLVNVAVEPDSLSLRVTATSPEADQAVDIADAFTIAFLETSNREEVDALEEQIGLLEGQVEAAQRRLEQFDDSNPGVAPLTDVRIPLVRERSELVSSIAELDQQLSETAQQRESTTGPYTRLGEPSVSEAATGVISLPSSPVVRVGLLAALGLVLAALLVALLERLTPRLDTKAETEEALGLPVLSMVPYLRRASAATSTT